MGPEVMNLACHKQMTKRRKERRKHTKNKEKKQTDRIK
jgi:hypothetical protein